MAEPGSDVEPTTTSSQRDGPAAPTPKVTISPLEGTLLRDADFFPYYMLMALEAGGPLRALSLLLLSPVIWAARTLLSHQLAIQLQVFVAVAGLKLSEVRAVAIGVLTKFFLDDLEPAAYRALLTATGAKRRAHSDDQHRRRCVVVTSHPAPFVEHFLRAHLRVDIVLGSELQTTAHGTCTGFLASSGSLATDVQKLRAVEKLLLADHAASGNAVQIHGLCAKGRHHGFLSLCQEINAVQQTSNTEKVPREEYLSPLVFHDGRLVMRPTPLASLAIILWIPIGFMLAVMRLCFGLSLPKELAYPITSFLGLKLRVGGAPPLLDTNNPQQRGVIFVCVHRTLGDPTFLTMALRRKVRALAFKVSKVSEYMSPIHTSRLTRNREEDSRIIKKFLEKEDIFLCPEGTTCREPFLLRFSPLFAELSDWIVPVGIDMTASVFHGTSARGYKFMDGIFLAMNPRPSYQITFLEPVCTRELRESGKSAIEIANLVQKQLAAALGFQTTNYNRKDKYLLLAGHNGDF